MLKYILRRVGYILIVFVLMSMVLFGLFKAIPADPVLMYMEGRQSGMTPQEYQSSYDQTRERLGLDRSVPVQYAIWMRNMLTGDFGRTVTNKPVREEIKAPLGNTVRLNIAVMICVFAVTIPLGVRTAVHKGTLFDRGVQLVTMLGYSLPSFIIALVVMLIFSIRLGWLPLTGSMTAGFEGRGIALVWDRALHMTGPVMVMTFMSVGSLTRYIRAAMTDALRMDYIRTARAKGLREKTVIYTHAFRNSMLPFITVLIGWFVALFSGSVVVETLFIWHGMGKLFVDSILQMDYAVALALQMFYVILGLAGNLVADIAYTMADPRVRLT